VHRENIPIKGIYRPVTPATHGRNFIFLIVFHFTGCGSRLVFDNLAFEFTSLRTLEITPKMPAPEIKRALISVSDKTGVVEFAKSLVESGVEIYSTGGTRKHLNDAGIAVVDVADYTGFPEMMDGRVKTLHPKIFAGILCRHDLDSDKKSLADHDIKTFELVVVNLYPFAATIAKEGITEAEAIEQIDIGGPSLVRAAAKNNKFVSVVTAPAQYDDVIGELKTAKSTSDGLRRRLMAEAFQHTAAYDATIADYFAAGEEEACAPSISINLKREAVLRYGENSHQQAALYSSKKVNEANLIDATQLNGKQLSYNNLLDLDAALNMVRGLPNPACSVIKHNNPCGAGTATTLAVACEKGFAGDPVSAFGSVIGINRPVDVATAEFLSQGDFFVEAIVAPSFDDDALEMLKTKPKWKKNVRLLSVGDLKPNLPTLEYRNLLGGMLVQQSDNQPDHYADWKTVTDVQVDDALMDELKFGWHMVRFIKSNAICLSKDLGLVGVGAGQMSRVDSVQIAIRKAGPESAAGSVLSSDAFFPFADSIPLAAAAGVKAIIQPGGSVRDKEVIAACNEHGIPMVFAGNRHFRH
jgi:phosphoribosylaminoimidazolecarboxamide formyltransferase/IMP cyclohydrolase